MNLMVTLKIKNDRYLSSKTKDEMKNVLPPLPVVEHVSGFEMKEKARSRNVGGKESADTRESEYTLSSLISNTVKHLHSTSEKLPYLLTKIKEQ